MDLEAVFAVRVADLLAGCTHFIMVILFEQPLFIYI